MQNAHHLHMHTQLHALRYGLHTLLPPHGAVWDQQMKLMQKESITEEVNSILSWSS